MAAQANRFMGSGLLQMTADSYRMLLEIVGVEVRLGAPHHTGLAVMWSVIELKTFIVGGNAPALEPCSVSVSPVDRHLSKAPGPTP
ncbi:nitrate/nitrite two-component sensor NARX [Marssonina coronariae]|uniref:Nitrate/nitrite two-component sensor NARX n=1 Tax=Diplocarpon coronariae TaxID=2795749 RepID=A0A218YUU0_9HELO|nr:nitrate/nitrite two-component sensor NARX [Marssonina coronariae]